MVDKAPMMMMKVDRRPIADLEGVMEEVKELTEAMVPKPQSAKSTRPLKINYFRGAQHQYHSKG